MSSPEQQEEFSYAEADSVEHNILGMEPLRPTEYASPVEREAYSERFMLGFVLGHSVVTHELLQTKLEAAQREKQRLTEKTDRDDLTGLFTREYLISQFDKLQIANRHARRSDINLPHSLMVIDADHFKRINDTYGHVVGDQMLVRLAYTLGAGAKREQDVIARVGGEEFCILLPNTGIEEATMIAEGLRATAESDKVTVKVMANSHPELSIGDSLTLTVSAGVIELDLESSFRENYHRADQAMYEAKRQGRNQVVVR